MIHNMVIGGGSSGKLFAVIAVTYPSGSICTCSDGTKTMKAKDTSGYALFNVKAGTYTVECHTSDNSKSKSTSVTVAESDAGKSISVTLSYEFVLFDNGSYAAETGGWSSIKNKKLTVSASTTSMDGAYDHVYTNNPIDLSDYSTLHFILNSTRSSRDQGREVGVSNKNTGSYTASVEIRNSSTIGEHTLDISGISGSKYIQLYCEAWSSQNGQSASTSMTTSRIWLS